MRKNNYNEELMESIRYVKNSQDENEKYFGECFEAALLNDQQSHPFIVDISILTIILNNIDMEKDIIYLIIKDMLKFNLGLLCNKPYSNINIIYIYSLFDNLDISLLKLKEFVLKKKKHINEQDTLEYQKRITTMLKNNEEIRQNNINIYQKAYDALINPNINKVNFIKEYLNTELLCSEDLEDFNAFFENYYLKEVNINNKKHKNNMKINNKEKIIIKKEGYTSKELKIMRTELEIILKKIRLDNNYKINIFEYKKYSEYLQILENDLCNPYTNANIDYESLFLALNINEDSIHFLLEKALYLEQKYPDIKDIRDEILFIKELLENCNILERKDYLELLYEDCFKLQKIVAKNYQYERSLSYKRN